MAKKRQYVINSCSKSLNPDSKAIAPNSGYLKYGEIAVNYSDADPSLFIQKAGGSVAKFVSTEQIDKMIEDIGGITIDVIDGLRTDLANEIAERKEKDNVFSAELSGETQARRTEDENINRRIGGIADDLEAEIALAREEEGKLNAKIEKNTEDIGDEVTRATVAENVIATNLTNEILRAKESEENLKRKTDAIPEGVSPDNPLATQSFVNSTVSTMTGHYISNNGEPFDSLEELKEYDKVPLYNGDYAIVKTTDSYGLTVYIRYKYNPTTSERWLKEYELNNSSFTDEQWRAINSTVNVDWKNGIDDSVAKIPSDGVFTKTEILTQYQELASLISGKANISDVYTKEEIGNNFAEKNHTHLYAGSTTAGGAAITSETIKDAGTSIKYSVRVVTAMPSSQDANTIYILK